MVRHRAARGPHRRDKPARRPRTFVTTVVTLTRLIPARALRPPPRAPTPRSPPRRSPPACCPRARRRRAPPRRRTAAAATARSVPCASAHDVEDPRGHAPTGGRRPRGSSDFTCSTDPVKKTRQMSAAGQASAAAGSPTPRSGVSVAIAQNSGTASAACATSSRSLLAPRSCPVAGQPHADRPQQRRAPPEPDQPRPQHQQDERRGPLPAPSTAPRRATPAWPAATTSRAASG